MKPQPNEHEIWNEAMAKKFDPDSFITKTGFVIRYVESQRLRKAAQLLNCQASDTILDVGCGAGNILELLLGRKIVGLDLSDTLLEMAQKRIAGKNGYELIKADAEKIPFPEGTFDRIICSEVLEHTVNPEKVIQEILRVGKNKTQVVLTVPNEELINKTKKIILALGLKKIVAGGYNMSDEMLEEWHKHEIKREWLLNTCRRYMDFLTSSSVPIWGLAYHTVFSFSLKK